MSENESFPPGKILMPPDTDPDDFLRALFRASAAHTEFDAWLEREKEAARSVRCPSCGASSPDPTVWGLPGVEVSEAAERGEVFIGGCLVSTIPAPRWHCSECDYDFDDAPAEG